MSDFGVFARDLRLRVTNNIKQAGKIIIIPCSMGFKQQDGTWINEFIDVIVFGGAFYQYALFAEKGDQITVNGRMVIKQYKEKKSWQINSEDIAITGKDMELTEGNVVNPPQADITDQPF
jgi:single-stranded DNA-binding protein